jgi:hypothetical protein
LRFKAGEQMANHVIRAIRARNHFVACVLRFEIASDVAIEMIAL